MFRRSGFTTAKDLGVTIAVADAAEGSQSVTFQVKDGGGDNIQHSVALPVFLSDASTGLGFTANACTTIAEGASGKLLERVAGKEILLQTDATGEAKVTFTDANAGRTWYPVVVLPDGTQVAGDAVCPTPAG